MSQVVAENLRSAVYASFEELSAQVQADSALDAKLLGLLGFFAVAGSVLLTLPCGLRGDHVLLLVGVAIGALTCVAGSMGGPAPSTGPLAAKFYVDYGMQSEVEYLSQLLADLASAALANETSLQLRRSALSVAIGVPVGLAAAYVLAIVV